MSNHADPAPLVEARAVSKSFGQVKAVAPLSFSIKPGETVALAGPSGSGKTTLLHLLAGLEQPDSGEIAVDGRPLSRLKSGRELAQLVGMIHQQYDLVPHLPVVHNVLAGRLGQWGLFNSVLSLVWPEPQGTLWKRLHLCGWLRQLPLSRERQLALDLLGRLGIADKINERTSHLSGGEQQRVAIARLMAQSPRLILADEPVASLDPARAEEMLALLTGLTHLPIHGEDTGGAALVVSLHSPHLIQKYCSRVIGLWQGGLEFDLPTSTATAPMLDGLYDLDQFAPEVLAETS